ncbi:hypothetical protein I9W82_002443 [Candida metapsilosis]|uniref:Uncharacterized protein n=1 Tax=Candida metapsilosis TaxID=273372 RepID=A0A8H8DCQ7_9ASCO|nr:hypothetical protein I9W82_002443 [Candida metapsilosis]
MSISSHTPTFKVGLTSEEKSLYTQIFKSLDPENTGIITGEKARTTFEKSGLPPAILGEIWQIADQNNLGFLNQFGFCYAMRLIGYTQAGNHPTPGLADTPGPLPKFADMSLPQLQPQSTSSSFLSSQPNNTMPGHTTPQEAIGPIGAADYQKFSSLFAKTVGSVQGELGGAQAKDIFMKARLPTATLGQIWSLVDRNNTGALHVGEFVIAMHLVQGILSGRIKQLPPFLPDTVWQSVEKANGGAPQSPNSYQQSSRQTSVSSQQTAIRHPPADEPSEWVVTPVMKSRFDSIFNNLDKEHAGHLNPDQVASYLMTSKLDQQDLATVWDLADIQNTGLFTKLEFSIALFLVNRRANGKSLPNVIPDSLITSIKKAEAKPAPPPPPPAKSKSSMDDLVDVFGSPSPQPQPAASATAPPPPQLQQRESSSDLTHSVKPRLTSSFKPTSSFGQSLLNQHSKEEATREVESPSVQSPPVQPAPVQSPPAQAPQAPPSQASPAQAPPVQSPPPQKQVNYDALRSVPPPPASNTRITQLESQLQSKNSELEKLQTTNTQLQEQLQSRGNEMEKLQKMNTTIGEHLQSRNTEVERLQNVNVQVAEQLQSRGKEIEKLQIENAQLKEQLLVRASEMEKLQTANTQLQEQLQVRNGEVEKLQESSKQLELQLHSRVSEMEKVQATNKQLEEQLQSRAHEVEKIQSANTQLEEQLQLQKNEVEKLQEELAQAKRTITQHQELQGQREVAQNNNVPGGAVAAVGAGVGAVAGAVLGAVGASGDEQTPTPDASKTVPSDEGKDTKEVPPASQSELQDTPTTEQSELPASNGQSNTPLSTRNIDEPEALETGVVVSPNFTEEFPPIKELDLHESDSDEDSHFDDAADNFKQPHQQPEAHKATAFDDDMFNDLQPATEDVDENFNLEPAQVDNEDTTEFEKPDDANDDEWEQLFAGFGNA